MPMLQPGQTGTFRFLQELQESGCHGAVRISSLKLNRSDGTALDLTPADVILREEAKAVSSPVETTVSGAPSFGAGGGTGGKDIYTVSVASASGLAAGNFIRSKAAGKGGVYKIDSISGTDVKVFAGTAEMDIENGATIEKVTPEGWYAGQVNVSYANLNGLHCVAEVDIDVLTSADRANKPAALAADNARVKSEFGPNTASTGYRSI